MKLSAVSISHDNSDSITTILDEYVDPFFIDSAEANIEATTGALRCSFKADFFGELRISKALIANVRGDLWRMAHVANEFFERRMTECASHGAFAAGDRPIALPEDLNLEFFPSEA